MTVDDERKKHLAQKMAEAVGGVIIHRDDIKDADGRTLHDYVLQRHTGASTRMRQSTKLSGISVPVATDQARMEHEKRGGGALPQTRAAAAMKVGSTVARAQHNKLGGAPLPPVKKR